MFGHAIQKAFSTSLGGISTVSAFDTSTTCEAYALHIIEALKALMVEISLREVEKAFQITWPNIVTI